MKTQYAFFLSLATATIGCATPQTRDTSPKTTMPVTIESGETLLEQGDYEEAIEIFSNLLQQTPDNGNLQYYCGLAHKRLGRLEEAKKFYRVALDLLPDLEEAQINLGLLHFELGELDEARTLLETYAKSHDDEADAHYNLALILEAQNKLDNAEKHYLRSSSIDSSDPNPILGLGDVARKRKKFPKALKYYAQAIDVAPNFSEAHLALGKLLMEQGQTEKATEAMLKLESIGDPESAYLAGIVLAKNKREDEAKRLYEAALSFQNPSPAIHFLLANLLARRGEFKPAISHFEKFISLGQDPVQIESAKKRLEVCKQKAPK